MSKLKKKYLEVESWEYKLRVRHFPLQYNKNTQDLKKIRQRNRKLAGYFYTNGC